MAVGVVPRARQPVGGRQDSSRNCMLSDSSSSDSDSNGNEDASVHSDGWMEDASLPDQDVHSHEEQQTWHGPSPADLHSFMSVLNPSDPNYASYAALQQHEQWNNKYENLHWRPFRNALCFMLWLGWNDPALSLSRNQLQWILFVLLTLRKQGIIADNYWIPTNASTISKWSRWFPTPPLSMRLLFIYLFIYYYFMPICIHT